MKTRQCKCCCPHGSLGKELKHVNIVSILTLCFLPCLGQTCWAWGKEFLPQQLGTFTWPFYLGGKTILLYGSRSTTCTNGQRGGEQGIRGCRKVQKLTCVDCLQRRLCKELFPHSRCWSFGCCRCICSSPSVVRKDSSPIDLLQRLGFRLFWRNWASYLALEPELEDASHGWSGHLPLISNFLHHTFLKKSHLL